MNDVYLMSNERPLRASYTLEVSQDMADTRDNGEYIMRALHYGYLAVSQLGELVTPELGGREGLREAVDSLGIQVRTSVRPLFNRFTEVLLIQSESRDE